MSNSEFEELFQKVCNWGKWGPDDEKGTLNYIKPEFISRAAALVRSGRSVSMSRPINTRSSVGNPNPAIHHMTMGYDLNLSDSQPQFVSDYLGCECHGDAHSHFDALCHVAYNGKLYNGKPLSTVNTQGAKFMDINVSANGIVGRGVLLDIPRLRGVKWLEPGEYVTTRDLEEAERSEGVRLGEGDIFVFRTGHYRRLQELGPWDPDYSGEGTAGLHPTTMILLHERKVSAFLPDGDGDTVPMNVQGVRYPIHALQISSMGMACGDSLQLEDVARVCEELKRWEFMVVVAPLRLQGGTGSLVNPIAIF
ncbi:MAG TPA: cyclase family protein [Nitrososphaerales archaeon]|nr:cyclase family protein [Nitrososphaerales archaeon]